MSLAMETNVFPDKPMFKLPFLRRVELAEEDSMLAFASEAEPSGGTRTLPLPRLTQRQVWMVAGALTLGGCAWAYASLLANGAAAGGSLQVDSNPPGIEVRIDGAVRGRTPVALTLAAGPHVMRLERDGQTQQIPVQITERGQTSHHISWVAQTAAATGVVPRLGALQVLTDPAGASVEIDGVNRGMSPVALKDLTAGEHVVLVRRAGVVNRRTVVIEPGSSASLLINTAPPTTTSGWIEVTAGIPLQILEAGTVIGTTEAKKLMLPAGTHELEFADAALGFHAKKTFTIVDGRTTAVAIPLDRAPLSVNASPWAEVWIDGTRSGETPMAAVMTTIGPHMVEFRHPELGRKSVPVQVSLKELSRVSVDMRTR
jgi:hypothetical protein